VIGQAREWLAEAASLAVLTGAGISAESGIPTFRGAGGLWKDYKPEDLATPEAFVRDPRLVNPAHLALAQLKPGDRRNVSRFFRPGYAPLG
jgi:NAD-dependent SIR2 family protein deacetylase